MVRKLKDAATIEVLFESRRCVKPRLRRWEAYSAPPDPLAGFWEGNREWKKAREGKGTKGDERKRRKRERGKREWKVGDWL